MLISLLFVPLLAAAGFGGGWFQAILGIGFLIFIHEWGHYIACVLTKTRTEAFSIGFGPRLFGWERDRDGKRRFTVGRRQLDPDDHAMDFKVSVLPLGGYVKMAGGEIVSDTPGGDPDFFVNKPAGARIFILSAGVIMNLITAVVFYSLAYGNGKPMEPNVVGSVQQGSAAWSAEVEPGDRIVGIGDSRIRSFYDVRMAVALLDQDALSRFDLERDGKTVVAEVQPHYQEEGGHLVIGVTPGIRLLVGKGDDQVSVDFAEHATVAGLPVRGGAEAALVLGTAIEAGQTHVEITDADGKGVTIDAAVLEDVKPDDEGIARLGRKIGLEPFSPGKVTQVRGAAADSLRDDDVLVEALLPGDVRLELHARSTLETLPFRAPIVGFRVFRGDASLDVPVALDTPAEVAAWLDDVAVEFKPNARVAPIEVGRRLVVGSALYRYPASPALDAGVKAGDIVTRIGETEIKSWAELLTAIQASESGEPLSIELEDGDRTRRTIEVTPVELERLGSLPLEFEARLPIETDGIMDALAMGGRNTLREISNTFRTIGALFSGSINFNQNIAGPITLAKFSKAQADRGLPDLLWFLAYVSVMLAVLNILPIPVLDGGHILFVIIEKVKGSPLKEATVAKAMYVGLFMILTLMFFAFKNDILRLLD